jgi:hypothetical protein
MSLGLSFADVHDQTSRYIEYETGTIATATIDFGKIKSWLDNCTRDHGANTTRSLIKAERYRRKLDLILLDTELECLVKKPSTEQYIALSYVWGGTNLLRATSSTIQDLQKPGALRSQHSIPRVVQDAMTVVKKLGHRFLWVDCLCIVQDSDEKHRHIATMDIIYAQAFLTIVAVDGKNANTPLPGVTELSRLPIVSYQSIGKVDFVSEPPEVLNIHLTGSIYESRSWTLQERALSNRLLYFSAQQAIYECDQCFRSEYDFGA